MVAGTLRVPLFGRGPPRHTECACYYPHPLKLSYVPRPPVHRRPGGRVRPGGGGRPPAPATAAPGLPPRHLPLVRRGRPRLLVVAGPARDLRGRRHARLPPAAAGAALGTLQPDREQGFRRR